jgi:peroxiredoxin
MKRLAATCLFFFLPVVLRGEDPQALAQDFVRLVRSLGDLGGDPNTLAARREQAILLYEDFLASHPESVYSAMVRWSLFSSYVTVERADKAGQVLDDLQDALLQDLLKVAFAKQRMGNPVAGQLFESLEKVDDGATRTRVAQYMLTIGQDPQKYLALLQDVIDRPGNGDEARARAQLVKADLFRYGEQKAPLLAELVKKFPRTRAGQEGARKLAAASLAEGTPALPFTVATVDGATLSSEALRGKAVLLFFWSTWSYPSWKRIDELKKELGAYAPNRLAVIAVACEDFIERPKEFFANEKITWSLVAEGKQWHNTLALLYDVNSLPYYVLIDAKGNVVIPGTTKTEELLKALPKATAR